MGVRGGGRKWALGDGWCFLMGLVGIRGRDEGGSGFSGVVGRTKGSLCREEQQQGDGMLLFLYWRIEMPWTLGSAIANVR